uniref:SPG11 vesicle trafficking associated, spatacsin n=1 Tax=Leptobrachium leishanense TaxID=445787 RepID=A0A8C5PHN2_9ANUR
MPYGEICLDEELGECNKMDQCILLAPGQILQEGSETPVKVSLSRQKTLTLCSLLPKGSLQITTIPTGKHNYSHTQCDGPFTDFLWAYSGENEDAVEHSSNLLALREGNEVYLYKVDSTAEHVDLTTVCQFDEGTLRQLCAAQRVYIYDAVDGSHVIDLALPHRPETDSLDPLINIHVSPDLGILVVSSGNGWVLFLQLNVDLRQNLGYHTWCNGNADDDDDQLRTCNISIPGHTYIRTDRSWDAMLSSLNRKTRYVEDLPFCLQTLTPTAIASQVPLGWTPVEKGWLHILEEGVEDPVTFHIWAVSPFSSVFCILGKDGNLTVAHLKSETQTVAYYSLGKAMFVDCAPDEACLVITDKGLSLVQLSASQDEFLSRLMIHSSAGCADILCHLNNWDRCSVPIHTLKTGLENRQLDTVDFFLKSKESILNPLIPEDTGSGIQSEQYLNIVHDLVPALDLLFSFIRDTDQEAQTKHFSEQLLQFTLCFLNGQLRNLCILIPEPDHVIEECLNIFTGYITTLRSFMRKSVQQSKPLQFSHGTREKKMWENLSSEQLISDAILTNCIPEAQTFLRMQGYPSYSLSWVKQEGFKLVYRCLQEARVTEACQLLQNMGYSTWNELRRICIHTSDQGVRDLLIDLLQKEGYFSKTEREQIQTMHLVEQLYCNPTEDKDQKPIVLADGSTWKSCFASPEMHAVLEDVFMSDDNEPRTLRLRWAQCWDKEAQESLLLAKEDLGGDLSTYQPHVVWRHLTLWHSWPSICSWIEETRLRAKADGQHTFRWPILAPEIVDENSLCCDYMKQKILDKLLSIGMVVPSEVEDFESLLQRLAFANKLMPSPDSGKPIFFLPEMEFHTKFTLMCAQHDLPYLLYTYLNYHRLAPQNCPVLARPDLHEAYPWFGFLVQIRGIQDNPEDHSWIFHASLANAHMMMPGYQPSINSMMMEGHTLLALATTMYAPGGIDGVLKQYEDQVPSNVNVDPQLLKMALAQYPMLKAALFPQHPSLGSPSHVTLYQLLQALAPFSPTRLFTWQEANTLAAADSPKELPHFSCPRLASKLGLIEQLDVCYYLRTGRPSVAFANFLVHQLIKSKEPQKMIQDMAKDVYSLALSRFNVRSVVASCVCFLELLGVSSHKLRVDVNIGNLFLNHTKAECEQTEHRSPAEEIAENLSKLLNHEKEAARELSLLLEETLSSTLEREWEANPNLVTGTWSTIMQFCLLHSVAPSSRYLRHCAQRQDWLQLLVHANSLEQIYSVLEELNPTLRSHITLALQGLSSDTEIARGSQVEESSESSAFNVFHVLLHCQKSDRPRHLLLKESIRCSAPLLSVLAACVQGGPDLISCLSVWLLTSVDPATHAVITHSVPAPEDHVWDLSDLTMLWNTLLERKKPRILHRAFSIFTGDCLLLPLIDAYELCLQQRNYLDAKEKLQDFQTRLESLQSEDASSPALFPLSWIRDRASDALKLLLLKSHTSYEQRKVLQLLCDCESQRFCGCLDIHKLNALTQILQEHPVCISKELLNEYSSEGLQAECQQLLHKLLEEKHFAIAREVAELAGLPTDCLVIEEVLQEKLLLQEIGQWSCPQNRLQFWKKCHEMFSTNQVSPDSASTFFRSQGALATAKENPMSFLAEEELLLTLAGHWLSLHGCPSVTSLEEIEKLIWTCRIEREVLSKAAERKVLAATSSFLSLAAQFSFARLSVLNSPSLLEIASLPFLDTSGTLDSEHSQALRTLIDYHLDDGHVHEASRVCRYFQMPHHNLWLVLNCRALATGETAKDEIHPDIQAIFTEGLEMQEYAWKRKKRLQSFPSLDASSSTRQDDPVQKYLEILKDACTHGKMFCRQLLCVYELSQDLGCSFSDLASRDGSDILRLLISCYRDELSDRAQAVISSHRLSADTVAKIVTEEGLKVWQELDKDTGQTEVHNLSETRKQFLQLAKLCPDPSLVGLTVLDILETVPLTDAQCIIELLVAAHECFSLTCHLEGIRRVLQTCRYLIEMHLAPNKEYSLMVRLLSGIGRYNDMVYVFDILHKNQHFEILLQKKLDTKGGLQTALLEYIKRCHPGDSEKHNMTALCFSMHRDIGRNHEHAALIQLKLIQSQPWEYWMTEPAELRTSLMKALTLLIDAAESYSKESCVRQSLRCARLTRLLTLQIHLLNGGHQTMLINLEKESLMVPILALPRFYQAVIVTEAYDQQADWAEVLYQKVIVGGDFQYFEEFKQRQVVQSGLFEKISSKCKLQPPGTTGVQNLKRLINNCENTYTRYKLAFENEFFDITDVMMKDPQTRCCLTDLLSR